MADTRIFAGFGKGTLRFPREMFPLEGFRGVHDDPCVRLMLFSSGGEQMAIAAVELVNLPPRGVELCQNIIQEKTGIPKERIWIHVTHAISTMHEPGPMGPPDRRRPETERDREQKAMFFAALESAVTQAADEAASSFGPVKIGWGVGECDANVNRDVETEYGWWTGLNPQELSNKQMTILRAEDPDGTAKGFFISYGIKPCALDNSGMEDNTRLVSADVCGVCSRTMEERFGVPALFCVSAAGDQVPKDMALLDEAVAPGEAIHRDFGVEKGLEIVDQVGGILAEAATQIALGIVCDTTEAAIRHRAFSFPWQSRESRAKGPLRAAPPESLAVTGERQVEGELFTLGDAAFVAEKPEVNARTEQELWDASPFTHTLLICMVNGGMKYMPDRLAYERNTFEAQSSFLLPGAAERFVSEAAKELNSIYQRRETMNMKPAADFSSKHDILIRNKDGSYTPMDEPYYEVEKIAPGTWKIMSSGDHSYLVEGENEAVSIDTGYGAGNIRAFLQTLTDKPIYNTFNTHSHFDHSANNGYFEKAYMAKAGIPYASVPYASFSGIDFPQDYERVGVEEGFVYDLGGRTLEVFDIPDHTIDGIALLDRKERLLFTGDEFMEMGKPLHIPVHTFLGYLEKLEAHRDEFDRLCAGARVFDASFLDSYYECAKQIMAGNYGEKMEDGPGGPGGPGGHKGPRQPEPGPNGELIYDRQMPHPGDKGPEFYPPEPGYQPDRYALSYAGVKIMYDKNKL